MAKTLLKNLSLQELDSWMKELELPAYRSRQLSEWIYKKRAGDFGDMSNLPAGLRKNLEEAAKLQSLTLLHSRKSGDGSEKFLFQLEDGESIESVLMPMRKHQTLCISSQVGCAMACHFCETGRWGFRRNLQQAEILDQVLFLMDRAGDSTFNLVFMGMGEPLQNYSTLLGTLGILSHERGLGISEKRITVSTVGIPGRIRDLANSGLRVSLALSLVSVDEDIRRVLIPSASKLRIRELLDASEFYADKTRRKVTLEYVLFEGINDRPKDAKRLREIVQGRPFKLNIIPFNPGETPVEMMLPGLREARELRRPSPRKIDTFVGRLASAIPSVTVRWSQGSDVGGGCGQLRGGREG